MADGTTTWGEPTKGIVEKVVKNIKDGQHLKDPKNNYRHTVHFKDNPVAHGISTKDENASTWPVGQEVEYKPGKWVSGDGATTLHFASLVRKQRGPFGGGASPKGKNEYLADAALQAMRTAGQIISVKENNEPGLLETTYKHLYTILKGTISEIFNE